MDTNFWQPQGLDVPAAHGVSQAQSKHPMPCAERRMKREAREHERNFYGLVFFCAEGYPYQTNQSSKMKCASNTLSKSESKPKAPEVQNFPFFHLLGCYVTGNGNMAVLLPSQSSWAPEPDSAVKYSGWILRQSENRSEVKISMKSESYLDSVTFLCEHLDYLNFDFI